MMTLGTVDSKGQQRTLSVQQINAAHIFPLLETLDSALGHSNFWDKIVYEWKRRQKVSEML